jgi:hypothetical protein
MSVLRLYALLMSFVALLSPSSDWKILDVSTTTDSCLLYEIRKILVISFEIRVDST